MQRFALLFLAIVATIVMAFSFSGGRKSGISGGGSTVSSSLLVSPSLSLAETGTTASVLSGEEVIRTFINLIHEHKIPEAIAMMDQNLITNDRDKQQYGIVFNSFASIAVQKIGVESFGKDEWKEGEERYRVDVKVAVKPDSQPGFWENGVNTRWISVQKQRDGHYLIHDIATGP